MLSSDLGLGNVFRWIRLFLGLFYWVHQSLQKSCKKVRFSFYSILTKCEANIWWPVISEMRVNTKQVVTQTGFRTPPRSHRSGVPGPTSMADGRSVKGPQRHGGRNSDVYAYVDVRWWRLFVLARERKCDAFTSRQRTSSPGKLQRYQFNLNWRAGGWPDISRKSAVAIIC